MESLETGPLVSRALSVILPVLNGGSWVGDGAGGPRQPQLLRMLEVIPGYKRLSCGWGGRRFEDREDSVEMSRERDKVLVFKTGVDKLEMTEQTLKIYHGVDTFFQSHQKKVPLLEP